MLIDTNILIAYLKRESSVLRAVEQWKREYQTLLISSITFSEVLSYPFLRENEINEIKKYLQTFFSVPFDNDIGETAAFLRRLYRIPLPDAGIAATALRYSIPLVTRDREFLQIKEISVVQI